MGPAFARNSEFYYNPLITKVQVTVEGVPNQLYTQGMLPHHHWEEIVKEFGREDTYRSSTNMFTTYFQSRMPCGSISGAATSCLLFHTALSYRQMVFSLPQSSLISSSIAALSSAAVR